MVDLIDPNLKRKSSFMSTISDFILPLLMLGAVMALVFLVAWPNYQAIPAKKKELSALITKEQNLEAKIKKLNDLTDFKSILEENLNLLNIALPSEANIPLLLTQVQKIATESGLAISNLSYSSSLRSEDSATDKVNIQLSAKGTFAETRSFMGVLEKAIRIVDLSTLRFSTSQSGVTSGLTTSEIDMNLGLSSPFLFVESKAVTEDPITIDLKDTMFTKFLSKLKEYKVYETIVDNTNIGKENPFKP